MLQWFFRFSEFSESSAPFRENSNVHPVEAAIYSLEGKGEELEKLSPQQN